MYKQCFFAILIFRIHNNTIKTSLISFVISAFLIAYSFPYKFSFYVVKFPLCHHKSFPYYNLLLSLTITALSSSPSNTILPLPIPSNSSMCSLCTLHTMQQTSPHHLVHHQV